MPIEHGLERIILIPRNGYVNRLQAWASTMILGADLDVPVAVHWEPEPAAPAPAEALFAERVLRMAFIGSSALDDAIGAAQSDLPRYLTAVPDRGMVILAGHDRGEQAFMGELAVALSRPPRPRTLVIIAGGKFHLGPAEGFAQRRRVFYRSIAWSAGIDAALTAARTQAPDRYLGLHVRGTDRSIDAPTARQLRDALAGMRDRTGVDSLFVAADTAAARDGWRDEAQHRGFEAWAATEHPLVRGEARGALGAMVDWVLLGEATAIAYSATSSFGEEAAVCTGDPSACVALTAPTSRRSLRRVGALASSAAGYPRRHGWLGRPVS